MTRRIQAILLLFFAALSGAAFPASGTGPEEERKPEKVFLDFSGLPAPGTRFRFRIRSIRTRNCEMKILGMDRPPSRRDTREVLASGILFYKAKRVAEGRLIRELEFTPDSICGFISGERFDFPEISGKTILIVTAGTDTTFRLKENSLKADPAAAMASDVLSGKSPEKNQDLSGGKIPPELLYFLKSLFGSANDPPVNYLGKSAWMERGRHTPLDPTPVVQALCEAGIPAGREEVEYFAEYDGSTVYLGIPVRRVNLLIQGAGVPGCDFKLEISLLYPYGNNTASSGPIRISRKALFVASPYLPEGNALLPGSRMESVETDMTDIQLIPETMLPH